MVTKGGKGERGKLGVWDWQIYTTIYKTDNKDLLCNTGNYTQYLVTMNNGKESEKECIHVQLNHFAVYLKLTTIYQ